MKIKASFDSTLRDTKLRMLKMHYDAQVGHLGSNLSCIDAIMTIYHHALKDEDQFIFCINVPWSENQLEQYSIIL